MHLIKRPKTLLFALATVGTLAAFSLSRSAQTQDTETQAPQPIIDRALIADQLGQQINENIYPESFNFDLGGTTQPTSVTYTVDPDAQTEMNKVLRRYKPDYAAFVAMDAETGKILAIASFSKDSDLQQNLNLRATFPAASIFKVVTAGAALDLGIAEKETIIPFNGRYHTLYKSNVFATNENRWTRRITLREAFAKSVNTFFGKLGLFHVGPQNLMDYAERFKFNKPINSDIPVQEGQANFDLEDEWSVVSAASGFTRDNTMSPIQGAMIAAAVANDGVMMEPYLIDELYTKSGLLLYSSSPSKGTSVLGLDAAKELQNLFEATVTLGTSRSHFRKAKRLSRMKDIKLGGKTGSLTGLDPKGKCDWFIGYAHYKGRKIAVAALTVNILKWRVRSATLATVFLEKYLADLDKRDLVSKN